jgi:HD-like signal output (HDOD) protein
MLVWLRNLFSRPRLPPPLPPAPPVRAALPVEDDAPAEELVLAATQSSCSPERIAEAVALVRADFQEHQPGPESFPRNASRILDVIQHREPDFNKLVHVVGQDLAMSARLLQVANSAAFGQGNEVASVRAAAMRLGFRDVGEIALGFAGRALFETEGRLQYQLFPHRFDGLFHQSMTSAFATGALALQARGGDPDGAFLVGMFHDVGKAIALRSLASLHLGGRLDAIALDAGIDEVLEQVHVEIGAAMTTIWSLPANLQIATGLHHEPEVATTPQLANLHAVRVVDGLSAARAGTLSAAGRATMKHSAAALVLSTAQLRVAANEIADHAARVTRIFGVADPTARSR